MSTIRSRLKILNIDKQLFFEGVFLSLVIFFLFSLELDNISPGIFNLRDYLREQDLIKGHLIWYGPELSKNGNIPGPFYYYFLLIPYLLGGFKACAYFLALTIGLSFGAFWIFLNHYFFKLGLAIIFIILVSNPVLAEFRRMVWNPSFLLIFWSILIILLYSIFETRSGIWNWYFYCIVAALSVQIHMMSLFWIFFGSIFYLSISWEWRVWLKGIIFFLIPFLPYYIWDIFFKAHVTNYKMAQISMSLASSLTEAYQDTYSLTSARRILETFYMAFGFLYIATFLICIAGRIYQSTILKKVGILKRDALFVGFFFLTLLFLNPVLFQRQQYRYLFLPTIFGLSYIVFAFSQFYKSKLESYLAGLFSIFFIIDLYLQRQYLYHFSYVVLPLLLLFFLLYFTVSRNKILLMCLISILFSTQVYANKWRWFAENIIKFVPLRSLTAISELIANETSWSSEEFRQRVYWVGVFPEFSPVYVYDGVIKRKPGIADKNIGYIVVHNRAKYMLDFNTKLEVEPTWRRWIKNSKIIITSTRKIDSFTILTYKVNDKTLPVSIQNVGLPNSISSRYLEDHRSLIQFHIPTFEGKGPQFHLLYDRKNQELTFFSEETSRFFTLGPNIVLKNGQLNYFCDQIIKTIKLPTLGGSFGKVNSDIYQGYSYPQSFLKNTIYTPLTYKIEKCQTIKPVEFSAQFILFYVWSKPFNPKKDLESNFQFKF
ncbi:MAG: hypothetical protein H7281_11440 [Bacteriovorax sp.]|nr:hypothetical protein [Bacteriovorax sp.]